MSTKSSERSAGGRLVEVGKRVGLVQVVEIVDLTTPAQLVAAALDRAQRAGQDDLEVGQLGVDVVVDLAAHPADRSVDVVLSKTLLDGLNISSTLPRAAAEFSLPGGTAYRFALSDAGGGKLVFNVEPSHMGWVTGQVLINGAATPIHFLVWP